MLTLSNNSRFRLLLVISALLCSLFLPTDQLQVAAQSGEPEWTWLNPLPQGNDLYGVWGSGPEDVFAVGNTGTILHFDGSDWERMNSGTNANLRAIWGSSSNDIFVVGETVLHYDGTNWVEMLDQGYSDVWGSGPNNVFVVGGAGAILHYDGSSWTEMHSGTGKGLLGVWGSSDNDVFAVGYDGIILHYDGSSWKTVYSYPSDPSLISVSLNAVWGSSSNNVYAVGRRKDSDIRPGDSIPVVLHYNGYEWSNASTWPGQVVPLDIWGSGSDDVFAVGDWGLRDNGSGAIARYDGNSWVSTSVGYLLKGVWGSSGSDVFAVGRFGTIQHFNGTDWLPMSSGPTLINFNAIMGTQGQETIVVGEWGYFGYAYHYDRSNFAGGVIDDNPILGVWAYNYDDIYAVSLDYVFHYNGIEWKEVFPQSILSDKRFNSIWGSDQHHIYAVGDKGYVLYYDGDNWSSVKSFL